MARWLLDTNTLLRAFNPADPNHLVSRNAVLQLRRRGDELCVTLQVLAEFWCVCTRPSTSRGGFGMSHADAERRLRLIERYTVFLVDTDAVRTHWRDLVTTHRIQGVQVHDARLVASMLAHGVTHLLTFDVTDFRRYGQIQAAHPQDVLSGKA